MKYSVAIVLLKYYERSTYHRYEWLISASIVCVMKKLTHFQRLIGTSGEYGLLVSNELEI